MNWFRLDWLGLAAAGLFLCVCLTGCGDDACADLAEMCATCPADGQGPLAQASCQRAADAGDELACEDRLESGVYEGFGCTSP